MAAADQWRWTDEDGVQRLLAGDELRAAIAEGRLKPSTLVWRRGMKSWLPAASVPELTGIGGRSGSGIAGSMGRELEPTPSVPDPGVLPPDESLPRPSNMIDIASLRARQSQRPPATTDLGLAPTADNLEDEDEDPATDVREQGGSGGPGDKEGPGVYKVMIPQAPKLPSGVGPADDEPRWPGAPRGDREQTVTRVRDEETDDTTIEERVPAETQLRAAELARAQAQREAQLRAAAAARVQVQGARKGSSAPPPRRSAAPTQELSESKRPPPPPKSRRELRRGGAGFASSGERAAAAHTTVTHTAQISGAATYSTMVSGGRQQQEAMAAEARRIEVHVASARQASSPELEPNTPQMARKDPMRGATFATGPLPEIRPEEPSQRPNPRFASEAWEARPAAAAAAQAAGMNGGRAATAPLAADQARDAGYRLEAGVRPERGGEGALGPHANQEGRPVPQRLIPTAPPGAIPAGMLSPELMQPVLAQSPLAPPALAPPVVAPYTPTYAPPSQLDRGSFTLKLPLALAAAGGALLLVAASFLLGRATAPARSELAAVAKARSGLATVPLFARTRAGAEPAALRPCLMQRAPSRWAKEAYNRIAFETLATGDGKLAIGFAQAPLAARGMLVAPESAEVSVPFEPPDAAGPLSRVVPLLGDGGEPEFRPTLAEENGVREGVWVGGPKPFVLGFAATELVALDAPDAAPATLWALPGGDEGGAPDALTATAVAGKGVAVSYRHAGRIYYGWLDEQRKALVGPVEVVGQGGKVGKPSIAAVGGAVSIVFAEKPEEAPIGIRWATVAFGAEPKEAPLLELPPGGPGGDAIAPAIAALSGGRSLLLWTEGSKDAPYTLRAQTFDSKREPIGQALRVSPETGSFGQGSIGVVGESAAVVFLLSTSSAYEIWGTVLQCR